MINFGICQIPPKVADEEQDTAYKLHRKHNQVATEKVMEEELRAEDRG